MKTLLFANGDIDGGVMVHRALSESGISRIIAADGGAYNAQFYGQTIDTLIGDLDSLSPDYITQLESNGVTIHRYPPEKDETDLELALQYAVSEGATWIRIIGAMGGRFDHMLANVYLLGLPQLAAIDIAIVAGNQMLRLLMPATHHLIGQQGDTISLIPISGNVQGITTIGLQYPLSNETLSLGPARGISNVMLTTEATVTFTSGLLLYVHTVGRA